MKKVSNKDSGTVSFAEGLFLMAQKNIIEPIRLNKARKRIILTLIAEAKEKTSTNFENDDEVGLNRFLIAMEYLTQQVGGESNLNRIKLTKTIAWQLNCLMWDNKYHWLSSENEVEFEKAMQWIAYNTHKKYSEFEITKWWVDEK